MINVAEINEYYTFLAASVFKRKFANKLIDIRETSSKSAILKRNDIIMVGNFKNTLKLFKYFGPFISKLRIIDEIYKNKRVQQVLELINRYPETITTIELKSYDIFTLNGIKNCFGNVENIFLTGQFYKFGNEERNLSEIFPKIRHLYLGHLQVGNPSSIHQHFEHLESFHVNLQGERGLKDNDIQGFIKFNPQIRSLYFESVSIATLKIANEQLAKLETLDIKRRLRNTVNFNGDAIHLESLRKLKLNSSANHFFRYVYCDQLEELSLSSISNNPDLLIYIIKNNPRLTKLDVFREEIYKEDINRITGLTPNLAEASFIAGLDIDIEIIQRFLIANKKMESFKLKFDIDNFFSEKQLNKLQSNIVNDWITKKRNGYLIFERRVERH